MAPAIAATIGHPTANPMDTTPGTGLVNLSVMGRRMLLEVLAIIGQSREILGLDVLQSVCQSHFTVPMMVAVRFAVSCDVNELVPLAPIIERAHQAVRQSFATNQQILERNGLRNRSIIKEHGDALS